jgi:hypothetical protein
MGLRISTERAVLFIDRVRGVAQDMKLTQLMRDRGPQLGNGLLDRFLSITDGSQDRHT